MAIHQKTNEFLLAARTGNNNQVSHLINQYGIGLLNSQDHFGTSALHMAVMYGQYDTVKILITQPSINLNLQAYQESEIKNTYSPLDLAIKYNQPIEMVQLLLDSGASTKHPTLLLMMLFERAFSPVDISGEENNEYASFEKMTKILDLLVTKVPEMIYINGTPLLTILQQMVCFIEEPQEKILMQKMIDMLLVNDKNHYADMFVTAKDFTHAYPSDNSYTTINKFSKNSIDAEGHFTRFTVNSFHESMIDYQLALNHDLYLQHHKEQLQKINHFYFGNDIVNYTHLKENIFSEVYSSFYIGEKAILNAGLYDVSKMLFQLYDQGQTILLPTGWSGHAIDIILDKTLGLYVVANAGERYKTLPAGISAYQNNSPISADDIYRILNNDDQYNLEYEHYYHLSLAKSPDFSQVFPNQEFGNCALHSLFLANWSLTYINLYKNLNNPTLAKQMADMWHQDMIEHHKTVTLKNYLAEPYFKDDKPLYDALVKYESKLDHVEKIEQTHLILSYLTSPEHASGFKHYYKKHQAEFSSELKQFIQDNGYSKSIKIGEVLNNFESKNDIEMQLNHLDSVENLINTLVEVRADELNLYFNFDKQETILPPISVYSEFV
jgi:hypothetical protein